ncbi:clustered mitochondria protein isoform X1 [Nicotiana sylvestris]|uniref:Clustered mitochondria protein homolog n=1 Tax=Nicotiana sylvestris TaxID=4096 RepID=A0A1U7VMR5_NICSY|nr:PREDICTED: clustered mitochondria protein isoform X1 [Nicotiana sylvestris]
MAGKSNKGKNRKAVQNLTTASSSEQAAPSDAPVNDTATHAEANGTTGVTPPTDTKTEATESGNGTSGHEAKQGERGDIHLYPVTVKTQGGDKLELQLSPGDSVMDVRQFLLDAPETCFVTCYDLLLHIKDGSVHHLEDYNEISEVADITTGDCFLEMVPALYDDRSIRAHVHRTRELLSLSTLHSSLSTSLALQHEMGSNNEKSGEPMKADVPELENLGFVEDVSGSVSSLLAAPSKETKCVESIVFSSFNPPPSYRRLSGDLIYLDVVTLEGNKYCVTGTTKTFYVNSSTANVLDPRSNKTGSEATTLIGLFQKISSRLKKAFREILERKASAHPFENVQSMLPPNSWLGSYPIPDHKRDAARAENALTLSFGSELIGMQRDWNEELQSCREFPHTNPQERILRDRALYKVSSDFVDAAISGAIGVINRCIPPINPTDPECFHMYVHNNIFFSFAVDADLEQLPRKQGADSKVEGTGLLHCLSEKTSNNLSQGASEVSNGDEHGDSVVEAVNINLDCPPGVPGETQLAESEQATYASANNDLKGTKSYQEADVPGLYNLAMAIIDYRGHRVVAQSVLPGILQGDKSDSLLYGSVDNGKKICWSDEFHSKVLEAAKRLHLKEHTVLDGSGNEFKLAAPVECKGIVGSDDRHYLLDLMRVTPRDANYSGPGSRFCILRPELITAFCQAEVAERSKSKCESEGEVPVASDSSTVNNTEELQTTDGVAPAEVDSNKGEKSVKDAGNNCCSHSGRTDTEDILFNPNVFTDFNLAGSEEEIVADQELVKKVSLYLKDTVLPKFIQDLCTLEVSPMDGQTLTEALHAHGINLRYLGKVAEGTRNLPHLWDLCSNEIVVRCAKHILKDVLRDAEDHDLANTISHFCNCLLGNIQTVSNKGGSNSALSKNQKKDHISNQQKSSKQGKRKNVVSAKKKLSSYLNITSDSLWSDIQEFAKLKYQFELPEDAKMLVKKIPVVRNLCQKVGATVAARKYDLVSAAPFQASDIMNLQPVVKHSIPVSSEAKDLVETGKAQLAEGLLSEAYTLFSEAFTILQQVTGPMHREVANCCRYLAMVLYHAGDMAGAIMQQHKELIINERCLGLDHPDTAHSYGNMALFYHGLNQTELALRHMSRALLLLGLSSGPDHPDVAATFINVAMMYQDIGKMDTALRYLQEALKKNERLLGEEHIQTAVCYHALAIAFNCMGAFKLSHQHEKKTYDILAKQLGEEDSRTRDSQNWMKTFKMREIQMNAQKQKGQSLNVASAQKAYDILKAHPSLLHAFQAAAGGAGVGGINQSLSSAVLGDGLPRGRGVDERAARAAAEVRKKAAARGLLVRPSGVPAATLPPLTQLLNVINSGAAPDAAKSNETNEEKKEANGNSSDGPGGDAQADHSKTPGQDQTPVGLGTGLAGLDAKKQKSKGKSAS